MAPSEPLVDYQIAIRGSTLDGIRKHAQLEDISIRKWIRESLELMVKIADEQDTMRRQKQREREAMLRREASA
jgi:hypothetical protein